MKKSIFTIIVLLLTGVQLIAADYFWVGGSGNWSDAANHWATTSGGGVFHANPPTNLDDVYFDANSFPAPDAVVTVDENAVCRAMDWTGASNNPQFTGTSARTLSFWGSLTLIADMNFNFLGNVYLESLDTDRTLTSAGQTFKREVHFQGRAVMYCRTILR
jgi:hypothetical protein